MKEFIAAQIERIGNIKEKIALKELLNSVFVEMYETCEAKYDALEQRVLEEIPLLSRQYSVHTTVMERERADESQTYLFPMVETDLFAPVEFDPPEVQQILDTSGSCRLFSVFYEKDYLDCRALLDKKRVFGGTVRIGEKKIPARFIIKRAERYFDCVAGLYQLFYSNNVDWQTVNAPYLTKFVDVCFIGTEDGSPLQAGEESAGFTVDFEDSG